MEEERAALLQDLERANKALRESLASLSTAYVMQLVNRLERDVTRRLMALEARLAELEGK